MPIAQPTSEKQSEAQKKLTQLVVNMLSVNPSQRPFAAEILNKDWVKASTLSTAEKKVAQPPGNFF